jgi:hypothetical protein
MNCLNCGEVIDKHSGVDTTNKPVDDDLSVCFCCGHVSKFIEGATKIQSLNEEDFKKLKLECPEVLREIRILVDTIKNPKDYEL